jgi:parallel beta-helix repeat protein
VLAVTLLLLAAPTGAAAYDRLVNPFHSCSLGGTPEYATMQEAVDAARPGDQIGVCPGTYDQTVKVTKPVTLTGIGSVLIRPSSSVGTTCFDVLVDAVTVRYFTIQGCETGINVAAGGALIQNAQLQRNATGIAIAGGGHSAIQNNLFDDNGFGVLVEGQSDGTVIRTNTLRDDVFGIYLNGADGVIVTKNSVDGAFVGIHAGLQTGDSTISYNSLSFNGSGIVLSALATGNQIVRNVVTRSDTIDCDWDGSDAPVFAKNSCATESPAGAWD